MCFGTFLPEKTTNLLLNSVWWKWVWRKWESSYETVIYLKKTRRIKLMVTSSLSSISHSNIGLYNMGFYFPIHIYVLSLFSSFIFPHVSQFSLPSSQGKIPVFFDSYCSNHVSSVPRPPNKTPWNILLPAGSQLFGIPHDDFRDTYKMKRFENQAEMGTQV